MIEEMNTRQLRALQVANRHAWHLPSNGSIPAACACCSIFVASSRKTFYPARTASIGLRSMQATLHRRACGCLSTGRAFRSGLPSLRSARAVQDPDRSSLLASTPRGTVLKALLGGLILTAGFASTKSGRPVMAAAGSDIEKVHFLLNL